MATQQPQPSSSKMAQESSTNYIDTPLLISYKVPFSVRLRSAIFSVARFLRIMPEATTGIPLTPEFDIINKGCHTIDTYRVLLRSQYTEPDKRHLKFDHWQMTELRTYKDQDSKYKHEYLIATFVEGHGGKVHLRLERRIQDSSVKKLFKGSPTKAGPSDSDNDEQGRTRPGDQEPDSIKKKSIDDISRYPNERLEADEKKKGILLVDHVVFAENHRINLPQLIVLACVVSECSTGYDIVRKNCYWFCYIMTKALTARYDKYTSPNVPGKGQKGKWHRLPVDSLREDVNINDVLVKFDAMYEDFQIKIKEIVNNPTNEHTIAALQRAESAERRAEEERKRAEEEKRHAEEERKRAEEEKRRAEEEKRRAEEAERRIAELEAKLAVQAKVT